MTLTNFQIETLAKLRTLLVITAVEVPDMPDPENWEANVLELLDLLAVGITNVTQGDLTTLPWTSITDKPTAFPPETHSHQWSQIQNRPSEYPPEAHGHGWHEISGTPSTYPPATHTHPEYEGGLSSVAWDDITDKPSTFPPDPHGHVVLWSEVEDKPATFAPSAHAHAWADITDRPTTWAWDDLTGVPTTFPPDTHSHAIAWADIDGKPSTFAPSAHGHPWADITDKPSTYPPDSHSHSVSWADLTGKPANLSEVAAMPTPTTLSVVITSTVNAWSHNPATLYGLSALASANDAAFRSHIGAAPTSHSHTWEQVTGKPTFGALATLNTVANAQVADAAAIAWSKISKAGASPADVGAAAASHTHPATATTLTPASGWSQFSSGVSPLRYLSGEASNLVTINGMVAHATTHPAAEATIATLPSGKRPATLVYFPCIATTQDGNRHYAAVFCDTDGVIKYQKLTASTSPITWLMISGTFLAA